MAILKDLIVHGSSRFLNKIYASEIQTPLIEAEAGIIKKLKADDVTVVGLLDVQGQMHTNSWTNSNIATIDGSFYITPTLSSSSGTVSFSSAAAATFTGTYSAVSSLYVGNDTASTVQWTSGSKILITGEVQVDGEWTPLGTLLGTLNSTNPTTSMLVVSITDNRNNTSNILTNIYSLKGNTSLSYRNLKVSLYQRANSSKYYPLGIFMTALGQNGKTFLDIYGGVNELTTSYGGYANPNVRIGNLSELPAITTAAGNFTPVGWGIYTTNGYFSGTIVSNTGVIGGWRLGASSLYNGTTGLNNTTAGIYLGTDGIRNYEDANTYVNITEGVITAKGVDLTGEITATSGIIGGWNIGTDTNKSLYYGNQTPGATTTNLVLSPTSTTNSNAIGGSATGLNWFLSAGKVFGVTTAGALYATSGKIGGWQIGNTALSVGTWGENNSALICTGSGTEKSIGGSDLINNWVFTAGANFGVTKSGALYASSATISGNITATSLTLGTGVTIGYSSISNPPTIPTTVAELTDSSNYLTTTVASNTYATQTVANNAAQTATSYITYVNATDGIKIHNASDTNNYLQLNSSAINFYRNNVETLKIENSAIRVGKIGENEQNVYIADGAVQIRDNEDILAKFGSDGVQIGVDSNSKFRLFDKGIYGYNNNGANFFALDMYGSNSVVTVQEKYNSNRYWYNSQRQNNGDCIITIPDNCKDDYLNRLYITHGRRYNGVGGIYENDYSTYFTFILGTAKEDDYYKGAVYDNRTHELIYYNYRINFSYDGNNTLTLHIDANVFEDDIIYYFFYLDYLLYQTITTAPAFTFGTRGTAYILGDFSTTFGLNNAASGAESIAIGNGSIAASNYQTAIGKFNISDSSDTYSFIIGNGTSDSARSNAFTVDWSGNIISSGGATIGGNTSITGTLNATGAITQNGTAVSLSGHNHAAGDITSGILPIDKGGTGDTGTSVTTTASSIVTAGSGFTIESASYAQWGKVAMIHIVFKKNATAITQATNISLGTMVSGKRPKYRASAMTSWTKNALIYTDGVIHIYDTVAANASVGVYSTFILA